MMSTWLEPVTIFSSFSPLPKQFLKRKATVVKLNSNEPAQNRSKLLVPIERPHPEIDEEQTVCPTDLGWRPMDAIFKIVFWWEWILRVSWWSASPFLSLTCSVSSARWLGLSVPLCLVCKIELFFICFISQWGGAMDPWLQILWNPNIKAKSVDLLEVLLSSLWL